MAAATYGPLIFQAASQLNNPDPTREPSDNISAAVGSLGVGIPGALLGSYLGRRGGRSLAYRFGDPQSPDIPGVRRGGRVGGTIGGALGGLALAGVGANVGQGVAGFTKGDALSQQIRMNERLAQAQREAQEADIPLQRKLQDLMLRGYSRQADIDTRVAALRDYQNAMFGAANRPYEPDTGFSAMLAQAAMGGMG
jgi:hypothetical protein